MKIIKFVALIFILGLYSCTQEEIINESQEISKGPEVTATFEQVSSRTFLEEGKYLCWTAEDCISFYYKTTYNYQYQFDGETGNNYGGFINMTPSGSVITGINLDFNCAVYPYSKDNKVNEDGIFTLNMPAEQKYAPNSFGLGANIMVAKTKNIEDTFLSFKNVGGYLKLLLYGKDITVKSIILQGKNGEKLAGKAIVTPIYGGVPTLEMSSEATETVTLDCGEGVTLSTSADNATPFFLVVPPTEFTKGFTVTVTDTKGRTFEKSTNNSISIKRNVIKPMNEIEVVTEKEIPYVTFTSVAIQTLTMSKSVEKLEYSVGDGEWKTLGTNRVNFGYTYGNIRLRGKNSLGTYGAHISFGTTNPVSCSGDIRTLIDYENYRTVDTGRAIFSALFYGCSCLTSAPELPSTTLAENCYSNMFYNCSNLKSAPNLPSMTLAPSCYLGMFYGCSSLTTAPELPATTLASNCYRGMFQGCSNLNSVPELPAKTLSESCYFEMFSGCSKLISAPKLLATTLTEDCYRGMFRDCNSLASTPELPATTLTENCYLEMFYGCSSLTVAPELPATTLAPNCYSGMFYNCSSLNSAPALPVMTLSENCYGGMFYNCSSLNSAPELPATTLAPSCYNRMFHGCNSLISAPKLPAMTLSENCYGGMFAECSNLTSAPELAATILVGSCYSMMFEGCTKLNNITMLATDISDSYCLFYWLDRVSSTGTFIKAKEMTSLPKGASGIPSGWSVKDYEE